MKAPGTSAVLGMFVTAAFVGLLFFIASTHRDIANSQVVNIMIGYLGSNFGQVVSFYFGSSNDSAKKTQIIANQVTKETN